VNTIDDFLALLHDEVGLAVTSGDVGLHLDQVPGWDSVHLLALLTALERRMGRSISLPDVLEASNLADIYSLAQRR
jgi:acyl carrier protein